MSSTTSTAPAAASNVPAPPPAADPRPASKDADVASSPAVPAPKIPVNAFSSQHHYIVCSGSKYTDIDGLACVLGMVEFLTASGFSATAYLPASAPLNATIPPFLQELPQVKDAIQVSNRVFNNSSETDNRRLIVCDTSDPRTVFGAENFVPPHLSSRVFAVLDHHFGFEDHPFWVAQKTLLDIAPVASCASLVANYFHAVKLVPSGVVAALLFAAVHSNSLNLKLALTTPVDREMAAWLASGMKLGDGGRGDGVFLEQLFAAVTKAALDEPVASVLGDLKTWNQGAMLADRGLAVGQLELMGKATVRERLMVFDRCSGGGAAAGGGGGAAAVDVGTSGVENRHALSEEEKSLLRFCEEAARGVYGRLELSSSSGQGGRPRNERATRDVFAVNFALNVVECSWILATDSIFLEVLRDGAGEVAGFGGKIVPLGGGGEQEPRGVTRTQDQNGEISVEDYVYVHPEGGAGVAWSVLQTPRGRLVLRKEILRILLAAKKEHTPTSIVVTSE